MATEYKRINLLIGNAASLGSISEEGTPAIWSDTGYRLGWLADGAWKLAAMRGSSETFQSVTLSGLPANAVPRASPGKTLVAGSIQDTGSAVTVSTPLVVRGRSVVGSAWGCLYISGEGATAQSIPTGATYTKITAFTTALLGADGCDPDPANDQITVEDAGVYVVGFTRAYHADTANVIWHVAVFVNGVLAPQSVVSIKTASTATPFYADLDVPVVCAAGDTIDIRLRHDNGGSVNITYEHATLYVQRIA